MGCKQKGKAGKSSTPRCLKDLTAVTDLWKVVLWKGYGHLWLSRTSGQFGGGKKYIRSNGLLTLQAKRSAQKPADCPIRPKQLLTDPCKALKDNFSCLLYLLTPSSCTCVLGCSCFWKLCFAFLCITNPVGLNEPFCPKSVPAAEPVPVLVALSLGKELSTPFNHSHDLSRAFPHRCFIFIYPGEWSTAETISLFAAVSNTLL